MNGRSCEWEELAWEGCGGMGMGLGGVRMGWGGVEME